IAHVHLMFSQQARLEFGGSHCVLYFEENEICACGINLKTGDCSQVAIEPASVGDQALAALVISRVSGRQKRQEILRKGIQIPSGNEAAQTVEYKKIRAVAISQPEAGHATVLAHASHDQEIREPVGKRKKTGNRVTGEIDERFIDDDQLQIPRLLQKFHHLFERDELASRIAG